MLVASTFVYVFYPNLNSQNFSKLLVHVLLTLGPKSLKNEGIFAQNSTTFGPNATLILHNLPISLAFNVIQRKIQNRNSESKLIRRKKRKGKLHYKGKETPCKFIFFYFSTWPRPHKANTMRHTYCYSVEPTTFFLC